MATALVLFCGHATVSFYCRDSYNLTRFADVLQTVLLLVITALSLRNGMRARGQLRAFWMLMTLGFGAWLTAQVMWSYFEIVLRQGVPEPFSGDVVLFLHVVPMMAALVLRPHRTGETRKVYLATIDFVILLLWWMYLYIFLVIPWQYIVHEQSDYAVSFNMLYVAENVVWLGGLGVLWKRAQNEWRAIYSNLFVGGALYLLASQSINAAIVAGKYYTGSLYDLTLVASMLWFIGVTAAGGRLTDSDRSAARTESEVDAHVSRMAMVAMLSMPVLAAWSFFINNAPSRICRFRLATSLGAMLVIGFVVFAKQLLLDRERMRLLNASHESYTKLKRLQAQLVQSEKLAALGQLVSGAAHEINNPLTAIMGYAELIESDGEPDSPVQANARKIKQQAHRTKDLVLNLLRFAKQSDSAKTLVNINTILTDTLQLREFDLQENHVAVDLDLAQGIPPVWADQRQLLDVFFQLIGNAAHAVKGRADGVLIVRTRHDSESAFVEVLDNGPGIADVSRVFDPFYTTKALGKGAGLGLSAAYGMVKAHMGEISCENRPSGGASFQVRLPLASRSANALAASVSSQPVSV